MVSGKTRGEPLKTATHDSMTEEAASRLATYTCSPCNPYRRLLRSIPFDLFQSICINGGPELEVCRRTASAQPFSRRPRRVRLAPVRLIQPGLLTDEHV